MFITFISTIFTDIVVYYLAYDGRIMQSLWLTKWGILSIVFSVAGIIEERKKGSKLGKWYWITAVLLTLLGLSKL